MKRKFSEKKKIDRFYPTDVVGTLFCISKCIFLDEDFVKTKSDAMEKRFNFQIKFIFLFLHFYLLNRLLFSLFFALFVFLFVICSL